MSEQKYHINPNTGRVGKCSAKDGNCPYGNDTHHFPTKWQAQEFADFRNKYDVKFKNKDLELKCFQELCNNGNKKPSDVFIEYGLRDYENTMNKNSPDEHTEVSYIPEDGRLVFSFITKERFCDCWGYDNTEEYNTEEFSFPQDAVEGFLEKYIFNRVEKQRNEVSFLESKYELAKRVTDKTYFDMTFDKKSTDYYGGYESITYVTVKTDDLQSAVREVIGEHYQEY